MPYRALTHGRVTTSQAVKGETGKNVNGNLTSQQKAFNSQAGVSNSGPTVIQKNKLGINTGLRGGNRAKYAKTLKPNLLIPENNFGPDTNFVSNQGKGFPNANPTTSVGSTNTFARRAIRRRAVTKTVGKNTTSTSVSNCECK